MEKIITKETSTLGWAWRLYGEPSPTKPDFVGTVKEIVKTRNTDTLSLDNNNTCYYETWFIDGHVINPFNKHGCVRYTEVDFHALAHQEGTKCVRVSTLN
jgi:hypothetical protein